MPTYTVSESPILETNDYSLQLGELEDNVTYVIVNKVTLVMEHSDYLLPRVLTTIGELQARLDEARESLSGKKKASEVTSVEQSEDSIH